VAVASEIVLHRSLPALLEGTATLTAQDLAAGGYFGARKPEDGRIDWRQPARRIHDLVRAVAPPYPGAFTSARAKPLRILRTRVLSDADAPASPALESRGERIVARCGGGGTLLILDGEWGGEPLRAAQLGGRPVPLGENA
jgi:methionyl-tRNA formyltransferase